MINETTAPADDPYYRQRADLEIHFTDTRGGPTTRDLTQRIDPDEFLTTALRSDVHTVEQLDTWDREGALPYLAEEAVRLVTEDLEGSLVTGKQVILINGAPRDGTTENGGDFYAIRVRNLLIIGHAQALCAVKNRIRGAVHRVVGFSPTQQFRSSLATRAAFEPERLEAVPEGADAIPETPSYPTVAYVDRFGNVKLGIPDREAFERLVTENSYERDGTTFVLVQAEGGSPVECVVAIGKSLKDFGDGRHVLYSDADRGGRLALVYAWKTGDTVRDKVRHSAFYALSGASEGNDFQPTEDEFIAEGSELHVLPPPNMAKSDCQGAAVC